jgi:hypothetical protein
MPGPEPPEEALTMSNLTVFMRQGRVEQIGTPQDLYDRPVFRYVADFIGETNLLAGKVVEGSSRFRFSCGPATKCAVSSFLIGQQNTLPLQIWGLLRRGIRLDGDLRPVADLIWARLRGGGLPGLVPAHLEPGPARQASRPLRQCIKMHLGLSAADSKQLRPNKFLKCMEIRPFPSASGRGVGGWTRGGGAELEWLSTDLPGGGYVCILRQSGGSTLTADHLLEL